MLIGRTDNVEMDLHVRCCVEARSAWIALNIVTIMGIRGWNHLQNFSWDSRELTFLAEVLSELGVQVCQLVKESESKNMT